MDFDNYVFEGKNVVWCHWDLIRFLSEDNVNFETDIVGLCDYRTRKDTKEEVMVDLRVFYYKENDKYILRIYKDDETFDIMSFDTSAEGFRVFEMLPYNYPEYAVRPFKIVEKKGV